jgi:peptide/nickel transport system ATP-binding protein
VRHISHRVLVMYLGKLVEIAPCDALFASPVHPYTRALLAAVPQEPRAAGAAAPAASVEPILAAQLLASGCAFRDRCPYVLPVCEANEPPLLEVTPGHWAACHRSQEALNPLSFDP